MFTYGIKISIREKDQTLTAVACRGEVHNLTDVDILCLEKEVTDDEIKTAFFDL